MTETSSDSNPLLSIIIPTFNRREFVEEAVISALGQTWRPTEVIVVDDGSSDETPILLQQLTKEFPQARFRYAVQKNQGPSAARNRGMAMARGEYVKFLDSDDSLDPDACEAYLTAMRAVGADLCIGARRYMSPEGRKWSVNYLPPAGVISDPTVAFFDLRLKPQGALWCFKMSVFDGEAWDEALLAREDTDLLVRLLVKGAVVCGAPDAQYNQRYHETGRQIERQFEPCVLDSILASNERQLALIKGHGLGWRARRAFARSMGRTSLRLWPQDRPSALRLYRVARKAFPFPELVATESYPLPQHLRFLAYWLWLLGGVRLCGPLWEMWSKLKKK